MANVQNRLMPLMKKQWSTARKLHNGFDWEDLKQAMDAHWLRLIILSCLSPILIIIPAFVFRLSTDSFSLFGYFFSLILLIPWLLIPFLFVRNITSHSKTGKIVSFILLGALIISYIIWISILEI